MEQWASALVNLGIGGVGLYLFVKGVLVSAPTVTAIVAALDARIAEWKDRYEEMRDDRDAWRELALGNERSVDLARPIVAQAAGVVPPAEVGVPPGTGQALGQRYTGADQVLKRRRQRR